MACLYADENFPLPVTLGLCRLGHDVLTACEAGKSDQSVPDEEGLTFATTEGRAILTINHLHFIRLHRVAVQHSGIIVCTYDGNFAAQAVRIGAVISGQEALQDQLLRVNRPSA